jgi:amidohydrolase
MTVLDDARQLQPELVELRRALHREPELGLHLPRTQERVLAALEGQGIELTTGTALSSVTGVIRGGGGAGRTVLLRGDMDALPVHERNDLPYRSRNGAMHACGHDLHTAMVVGAARVLADRADELAGEVVLMFQPGEEGFDGARHMLEEGVLDAGSQPVSAAFALHATPALLPRGFMVSRPGPMLSAVDTLHVTVRGRGGHASVPHRAGDPVPAACEMVVALQTMVTRRFDVFDPVIVTVGTFHAGTQHNVIPDDAVFQASLRSFSPAARERVTEESVRLCRAIAQAHGLEVDAHVQSLYPVTVNDRTEQSFVAALVPEVLGEDRFFEMPNPSTGSEDFSLVLDQVPGSMAFLGACPPDRDPASAPYNHSPEAVFDDAVLSDGAAVLAEWALQAVRRT